MYYQEDLYIIMINQQYSKQSKSEYLIANYDPDEYIPQEQLILRIQNCYIQRNYPSQSEYVGHHNQKLKIKQFININQEKGLCVIMGLPGTGKTYLMHIIASQMQQICFIHIPCADLISIPNDKLSTIFRMAEFYAPSVIILDELDYWAMQHTNSFNILKDNINKVFQNKQISIIGIGNNSRKINKQDWPKIQQCIKIPLLNLQELAQFMVKLSRKANKIISQYQKNQIIQLFKIKNKYYWTPADINTLIQAAIYKPVSRLIQKYNRDFQKLKQISNTQQILFQFDDLATQIKNSQPSVSQQDILQLEMVIQQLKK